MDMLCQELRGQLKKWTKKERKHVVEKNDTEFFLKRHYDGVLMYTLEEWRLRQWGSHADLEAGSDGIVRYRPTGEFSGICLTEEQMLQAAQ